MGFAKKTDLRFFYYQSLPFVCCAGPKGQAKKKYYDSVIREVLVKVYLRNWLGVC